MEELGHLQHIENTAAQTIVSPQSFLHLLSAMSTHGSVLLFITLWASMQDGESVCFLKTVYSEQNKDNFISLLQKFLSSPKTFGCCLTVCRLELTSCLYNGIHLSHRAQSTRSSLYTERVHIHVMANE